jgi:hypothetical protein
VKVFVKGKASVDLSQKDFAGSGGFCSVYLKGSTAYKIYNDASQVIPEAKIQELASHSLKII